MTPTKKKYVLVCLEAGESIGPFYSIQEAGTALAKEGDPAGSWKLCEIIPGEFDLCCPFVPEEE